MALRIRFQYLTGASLGYSVERLADGLLLDQADLTFKATPTTPIANLAESATPFLGIYKATLANTPVAQFSNGNYAINVHNAASANQTIAILPAQMVSGDDNAVNTGGSGGSVDLTGIPQSVWNYALTANTTAGTFGQLVKDNIDAKVSTRSTFAGGPVQSVTSPVSVDLSGIPQNVWNYAVSANTTAGSLGQLVKDNLDVKVSTRSTFAGGAVQSVTSPVSVDLSGIPQNVWNYALTSISTAGSVGQLVKDNIDAKVSTRSTFAGGAVQSVTSPVTVDLSGIPQNVWNYAVSANTTAGSLGQLVKDNLDAKVSTRSTFAGGAVQSVTSPVTVGTNQDKTGYALAGSGLDAVLVEPGVNARQALAPILAATAGVISGAGSGQITIKGGSTTTTRILANTDAMGNRTSVILTLPS